MTTLADKAILSGVDNRPPMLEKDIYDSWKIRMELNMMNRQHGRMILEYVENGSLIWPSIEENGVTRPKKYYELSAMEAIKADCDVKATNIILQGLSPELRNSSNPRQQATINNRRVTVQPIQGRHTSLAAGTSRTYTSGASGNNSGKQRTVVFYNCKGEGHMSKQCTKTKRKRDASWFKDKLLLAMPLSEQSNIVNQLDTDITSDSNIIPYSRYVCESQQAAVQNVNFPAQQDALILSVIEQLKTQVVNCTKINLDNKGINETLTTELERYKDQVRILKEGFQNPFYLKKDQQLEPKLYDGHVIQKTNAIVIHDSEETLMLAEESHSKMLLKQKDLMIYEKKANTKPVDYNVLNQLSQDFETRFVSQTELSAELVFWSQNFMTSTEPNLSSRPTQVEVSIELPKVSMVNTSLKKLKHHLASFNVVVKERTTATAITEAQVDTQLEKEIFQRDNLFSQQSVPSFDQLFEIIELNAQSQEKDMVIKKLKERTKSPSGNMKDDKIKQELEEIKTINIKLDHRVTKLIAENEHLK
nr:hypothetical protein [Tanacetum cinerariifolium]